MREIVINGTAYKLAAGSEIIKRQLNPFKAKLGATGGLEFSDFGVASLEEYHDFRSGIGLTSDLPSESNRIEWSQGVDLSTPRSAVLGPQINTAGSFGVAPVKIIDFQNNTYAIGASLIAKWNTGSSAWDSKDETIGTPLDAIVIQDNTDEYFIVSDSSSAKYSTDGTTWNTLTNAIGGYMASFAGRLWFISTDGKTVQYSALNDIDDFSDTWTSPTGFEDPDSGWNNEANAYNNRPVETDGADWQANTNAIDDETYGEFLYLTVPSGSYDRVRFHAEDGSGSDKMDIDAYYAGQWNDVSDATFTDDIWTTVTLSTFETIAQIRVRGYNGNNPPGSRAFYLHEVDIGSQSQFELSGDFGTVYGLFEGKLLSDGSPGLYFHSNRGLFAIDVNAEKAYQQEVEYPPLTNAGRAGMYWNANLWVATGYGILKISPSTAVHIGPDQDDGLPNGSQGIIYAMETVNNWLVYCVRGDSINASSILKRNATLGGNLQVYTSVLPLYHNSGDDNYESGSDTVWEAQTFTPSINYSTNTIKLKLFRHAGDNPGTITVSIRGTTGGEPSGGDLTSGTTDGSTLTTSTSGEWREITVTPSSLVAGTVYAIVVRAANGNAGEDTFSWRIQNTGTYTGGGAYESVDSGSSWDAHTGHDFMFEVFPDTSIACLHHSPSSLYTNGRLWFGEGTDIKYCMFPDVTHNVKAVSSYEYVAASTANHLQLPIFRKLAAISKTALGVAAITRNCDPTEKLTVYFGLNGAAPTTSLGEFTSSPRPTILTFNSGLGTEFYRIQLAVKFERGTNTNSPELESLLFYYFPTAVAIHSFTFQIAATDENHEETIAAFETLRDTKTLVTFFDTGDPAKTSYNVKLSSMPLRYHVENTTTREGWISVTVQEIFEG